MATLDDVARLAATLPEVVLIDEGRRVWSVRGKGFAWERPYSKADLRRFGEDEPPPQPILAVRVADLHEKESVLAEGRPGFFTIPHFDGYPAVLIQLKRVRKTDLREAIVDGWLAQAPRQLASDYLATRSRRRGTRSAP
jgi:hypothetical protein